MHSLVMNPRDLLQKLMDKHGLNPNSLSRKTHGKTKQPQIYRFLNGEAKEPKRSTLEPVAAFFGIEVDALFDRRVAEATARRLLPEEYSSAPDQLQVTEPKPVWPPIPTDPSSDIRRLVDELGRVLSELPEDQRHECANILQGMAHSGGAKRWRHLMLELLDTPSQKQNFG